MPSSSVGRAFASCAFLTALLLLLPRTGRGAPLDAALDDILRRCAAGSVQIDVWRSWNAYLPDTVPTAAHSIPYRRIKGTGVAWDARGRVLTVADLAQPGDSIRVLLPNGTFVSASYLGQDPDLDLSVIQIDLSEAIRPIPRGPANPLVSRGWVLLLGHRHAHAGPHLTIHRALGPIRVGDQTRAKLDMAPDPALSGGAVLDTEGRLIGILLGEGHESLVLAGTGKGPIEHGIGGDGPSDLGWILPIQGIAGSIDSLCAGLRGRDGFLGIRARLAPRRQGEAGRSGVVIAEVIRGSPADRAGVRVEDRLVSFDGRTVADWDELTRVVFQTGPGTSVRLGLERGGAIKTMEVRLGDRSHLLWREKQRRIANGRERTLRRQIEGLRQELEFLRHQLAFYR